MAQALQECTGGEVSNNLTKDHQDINVAGMSGNPAEYTSAIVANSSIVALMNEDVIRPLDDLVAKHGQDLQKSQLITVGGKIMAVAFMANAQHLMYRADVLEQSRRSSRRKPMKRCWTSRKRSAQGHYGKPVGGAYCRGLEPRAGIQQHVPWLWRQPLQGGTAEPSVNSEAGINALNMMKSLSEYMNPDFLTHDSNATNAEYRAGNVALLNMWGSRAATQTTADGVTDAVKNNHSVAGPMTVGGGSTPASTLWWDGWTVAKNVSDAEAEATFIAMMNGIKPANMEDEAIRRRPCG